MPFLAPFLLAGDFVCCFLAGSGDFLPFGWFFPALGVRLLTVLRRPRLTTAFSTFLPLSVGFLVVGLRELRLRGAVEPSAGAMVEKFSKRVVERRNKKSKVCVGVGVLRCFL